ncbi:tandem-type lipoprotein [Enterococcus sp. BWR-S5]|uniref:tandem-type lipoprotein n=1 Tax=Enterococcus sp. BWR-S5 TaxID=2787714 RepID=UPI001F1B22C5|nr:tandem-type lipoprotein [Enterococcus sp. BWR-S5]MBL1224128.1 tandem-type lipoprotein [Enterococcus sp. BWR-S5]
MLKKGVLFLGVLGIIGLLSGCETKSKEEVEQSFDKVLAMYPTKNLMDFYDMEGYRNSEFSEDDKGMWLFDSGMSISFEADGVLETKGMHLRMNRNTRSAEGHYYVSRIPSDITKETEEHRYPVTYDEQGFHLVEDVSDSVLKEKIENFQFFVQYGEFKALDQYENIRKMYNAEVPIYELEYQLTNDDSNVQQLRERYDISTNKAPTLLLKGRGALDGSSIGYKNIEFTFEKGKDNGDGTITGTDSYFSDSISYQTAIKEESASKVDIDWWRRWAEKVNQMGSTEQTY